MTQYNTCILCSLLNVFRGLFLELFTVRRQVDLHIFHKNTYWIGFCIKWIESFGEEVLSVVAKGGAEGRCVCHELWEDYGYRFGLNCRG